MLNRVWSIALMCGAAAARVPTLHGQEAADHVAMGIAANEAHDLSTALRHFQPPRKELFLIAAGGWLRNFLQTHRLANREFFPSG